MRIPTKMLFEMLGVTGNEGKRFMCRVYAALYRWHFIEAGNEWRYIGSLSPAEALGYAASSFGYPDDYNDDREWKEVQGK